MAYGTESESPPINSGGVPPLSTTRRAKKAAKPKCKAKRPGAKKKMK